jgi:hypothetical protein
MSQRQTLTSWPGRNAGAVGIIIPDDRGAGMASPPQFGRDDFSCRRGDLARCDLFSDDNTVDPPNGAISELPIRMNPIFSDAFWVIWRASARADRSGFGPGKARRLCSGVQVLAAVPPASLLADWQPRRVNQITMRWMAPGWLCRTPRAQSL